MNSLTSGPLADVLNELLAEAAAQKHPGGPRRGDRPRRETHAPGDFRAEFDGAQQRYMAVSPDTGKLLYSFVRASRATSVVEFGTSLGVSTLFLAAGIKDNGGGKVIGTEFEPTKIITTRKTVNRAGVGDIVEVREGDAMQTLAVDLPAEIQLVLLDGAKDMYLDVISLLEPHLVPGALVIADNANRAVSYREYVRQSEKYVTTGLDDLDLEISCKAS
jgi:predicted O-methyltransferase YrrM